MSRTTRGREGPEGREGREGQDGAEGLKGKEGKEGKAGRRGVTGAPGVSRRAAVIGYLILMLFCVYAIYRVEQGQDRIRASLIEGCHRGNDRSRVLIETIDDQIRDLKQTDPSFFPNIPRDQFQALIAQHIAQAEGRKMKLPLLDCAKEYGK